MQKLYGIPLLKDNIPFVCFVHTTAQPREIKIRKEMINTIGKFSIWAYNNFNPIELLQVTTKLASWLNKHSIFGTYILGL